MRFLYLFSVFLFFATPNTDAQIIKRFKRARHKADSLYLAHKDKIETVDSFLTVKYHRINYDTAYLVRPKTKWTLKGRANVTGARFRIRSTQNDMPIKANMTADHKATASLSISYMGITVGGALNPAALAGKYKDFEINVNSYSNRYGFDIITQNAKRFDGWIKMGDQPKVKPEDGTIKARSFNINGYYVFNYRKFSYPAAFTQSYIQKRSAGSLLVGTSLEWQSLKRSAEDILQSYKLNTFNFALGAGYGYNYVPNRRWLFHASALPAFVIAGTQKLNVNGDNEKTNSGIPQFILTARGAAVYNIRNYFLGANFVFNYSKVGKPEHVQVNHNKWLFRTFAGLRF